VERFKTKMKYTPWTDGYAVGFRCEAASGRIEYIYLNPSSEDSEGQPNVFLYQGAAGDPGIDGSITYFEVGEPETCGGVSDGHGE
jgi:hypothetical protein